MARLPQRGILVEPDGRIVWGWNEPDPNRVIEAIPPIEGLRTGREPRFVNSPAAVVLDLTQDLEPGDLEELGSEAIAARCRKQPDGTWKFSKILRIQVVPNGPFEDIEVEHPLETKMKARRQRRGA